MPTPDGQFNVNEVGKWYEMYADIKYIRASTESMDKTINGNGKPGLKTIVHDLTQWHDKNEPIFSEIIDRHKNETFLRKIVSRTLYVATGGSVVGFIAILNYLNK